MGSIPQFDAESDELTVEFMRARLMKMPLNLERKSNTISFVVAHAASDNHTSTRHIIGLIISANGILVPSASWAHVCFCFVVIVFHFVSFIFVLTCCSLVRVYVCFPGTIYLQGIRNGISVMEMLAHSQSV